MMNLEKKRKVRYRISSGYLMYPKELQNEKMVNTFLERINKIIEEHF